MQHFLPISREIPLADFDCGNAALNTFLSGQALLNQERKLGATTLLIDGKTIVGYYTLCPCHIDRAALPKHFGGQLPSQVPALRLARLAVDKRFQKNGCGGILLAHALRTAYFQSESLGGYAVLIDVKPEAKKFYLKYGMKMIRDSTDGIIMGIRMKDIPSYLPVSGIL